ncbi:hypothetical protein [Vibrio splendidus]
MVEATAPAAAIRPDTIPPVAMVSTTAPTVSAPVAMPSQVDACVR